MRGSSSARWTHVLACVVAVGAGVLAGCSTITVDGEETSRDMTRGTRRILERFDELERGEFGQVGTVALMHSAVSVTHHVRPRLGTKDALAIERHIGFTAPQRYHLTVTTRILVDGKEAEGGIRDEMRFVCSGYEDAPQPVDHWDLVAQWWPHLAPGRHEVAIRSDLLVSRGPVDVDAVPIWNDHVETTHEIDVAGETAADSIRLAGSVPLDFFADSPDVRDSNPEPHVSLRVGSRHAPISLAGRLEVRTPEGAVLSSDTRFFQHAHETGWVGFDVATPGLSRGPHELVVRLVPDPHVALDSSATVDEIEGLPVETHVAAVVR